MAKQIITKNLRTKVLLLAMIFSAASIHAQNWTNMFNGKNLEGWEIKQGSAEYKVDGNEIIGYSKLGTESSYLCTKKSYGDFILEVDVKIEVGLNSGIQFRSNSHVNGEVYGYQAEIDASDRKWSGGIFDQSRRGWVYPVTMNEPGREAFKNGAWNSYRIEAIGNTIRTWINGVQVANLVDDMTAEGFVAFQIHKIKNKKQEGLKIRWRGARILTENVENERWPVVVQATEISYLKNELTLNETRKGWRLLWDGKTTNGWKGAKLSDFPASGWEMKDGILSVLESGGGEARNGGDIVTRDRFENFELELEFRITPGANSGIKYFVDTALNKGEGSSIGCEFQILDDKLHPDAKKGVHGNRTVGSLYDLITANSYSEPNNEKRPVSPEKWYKARIIVHDGHVEHYLNNIKVVEYDRHSQMFNALVAYSKYSKYEGFGQAPEGRILLQDHGNTVSFRSIKIREN
ncbi:hypothetical protein KCTC52924_02706 [Arenibacter antarcticus]|uniref:DUF1080 domain-containing protein n=1 Tax=Arenibacter antarcticus TaxID=2040469 RepID=A0ABW5VGF6_9FLAO|nr:DUF1080 domain-containing protein [Arenibacter sp. H213]MCM4167129.1 DUF1080 domain-containing protein [Arenibacter sp. H213]